MQRNSSTRHYCLPGGLAMGWGGWTLPEVHFPHLVEAIPLAAAVVAFGAVAVWLFRRFGESSSSAAAAELGLEELVTSFELDERRPASEQVEHADESDREHAPAGV